MIKNSLGRELPEKIGDYVVRPYRGAHATPAPQGTVVTKRVMYMCSTFYPSAFLAS